MSIRRTLKAAIAELHIVAGVVELLMTSASYVL